VSLSALTVRKREIRVARTVLRRIVALDATGAAVSVDSGAILDPCRIVRNSATSESPATDVYVMEFAFAGRTLCCPLVDFQARTQTTPLIGIEYPAARESVTNS